MLCPVADFELELTADLKHGLVSVLGSVPETVSPELVLAALLHSISKNYGLSEHGSVDDDPLARLAMTDELEVLVSDLFGASGSVTADDVRSVIYEALVALAPDQSARKTLNKTRDLGEEALLFTGQIFWNIEADDSRPLLPIKQPPTTPDGRQPRRIPVPGQAGDFALMQRTARENQTATNKPGGGSFRKQAARLAVLVARHIATHHARPLSAPVRAELRDHDGKTTIVWPGDEPASSASTMATAGQNPVGRDRILVGRPASLGTGYEPRWVDWQIGEHWAASAERRVWLTGSPGLGKTFTARKFMDQALQDQSDDHETLLVWVDSANAQSAQEAFAHAAQELRARGLMSATERASSIEQEAEALLTALATSGWGWIVVLDNADPDDLIAANLIPPGTNSRGRTLITTTSRSARMNSNGQLFEAALFTEAEAESFLTNAAPRGSHDTGLASASKAERHALAKAVGYHPLALAIAASTITANALETGEWIEEFTSTSMDTSADEPDHGGYPHLIAATWMIALDKASIGLPAGVIQRTALVAALQNTDGHPTWLWESEEIAIWVAGDSPVELRRRMPVAVKRLIDHSVLELHGTWRDGQIAIHQLAARAIRESAGPAPITELATLLATTWLKRLTIDEPDPGTLLANIDALAAAATPLPPTTAIVINALHAFADRPALQSVIFWTNNIREIAPGLLRGGPAGQAKWASLWADCSDELERASVRDEVLTSIGLETPRTMRQAAKQTLEDILTDPELNEAFRAKYSRRTADILDDLGQAEKANVLRREAVAIYERLIQLEDEPEPSWVGALASLYEEIGTPERMAALSRAVDGHLSTLPHTPSEADPVSVEDELDRWDDLTDLLITTGRRDEAKQLLSRWLDALDLSGWHPATQRALKRLARLHADDGEWKVAERRQRKAFKMSKDPEDRVLLASLQLHRQNPAWIRTLSKGEFDEADAVGPPHVASIQLTGLYPALPELLADIPVYAELAESDPESAEELARSVQRRWQSLVTSVHYEVMDLIGSAVQDARMLGRWDDAVSLVQLKLEYAEAHPESDPWRHERLLANLNFDLGWRLRYASQPTEAIEHFAVTIRIHEMLLSADPTNEISDLILLRTRLGTAHCLEELEQWDELAEVVSQIQTAHEARLMEDEDTFGTVANFLVTMSRVKYEDEQYEEMVDLAQRAIDIFDARIERGFDIGSYRPALVMALSHRGFAYIEAGDSEGASMCMDRAVDLFETLVDEKPGKYEEVFAAWLRDFAHGVEDMDGQMAAEFRARADELTGE